MHLLLLEAGPQHGAGPPLGLQLQLEGHHLLGQLRHGLGEELTQTREVGLGLSRLNQICVDINLMKVLTHQGCLGQNIYVDASYFLDSR